MNENFQTAYDFIMQADNDGQPLHVTEGDPGGATVYGWTEATWMSLAPQYGLEATFANFQRQTKETLQPMTRGAFWNRVQGDLLPSGLDLFWFDFQFGSGAATRVLQQALGVTADGAVGPKTRAAMDETTNKRAILDRFLVARTMYYDSNGFRTRWPGLYRRAAASHALAIKLMAAGSEVNGAQVADPQPEKQEQPT